MFGLNSKLFFFVHKSVKSWFKYRIFSLSVNIILVTLANWIQIDTNIEFILFEYSHFIYLVKLCLNNFPWSKQKSDGFLALLLDTTPREFKFKPKQIVFVSSNIFHHIYPKSVGSDPLLHTSRLHKQCWSARRRHKVLLYCLFVPLWCQYSLHVRPSFLIRLQWHHCWKTHS
jgi:hypothetical protein